jgi:hypothetical protein
MLNPWFAATLLAVEASNVMHLRMLKMASGGGGAFDEAHLMVTEKIGAALEALSSVMEGGTLETVIDRYRELVAANAERLRL